MRRDGLRLLLILPDGSRSLVPAEWTDLAVRQEGPAPGGRAPSADGTAVPAGLGRLADLLHARSIINALLGRLAATPDAAAAEESLCATKPSVSRRFPGASRSMGTA
jgi:hypothetical protein